MSAGLPSFGLPLHLNFKLQPISNITNKNGCQQGIHPQYHFIKTLLILIFRVGSTNASRSPIIRTTSFKDTLPVTYNSMRERIFLPCFGVFHKKWNKYLMQTLASKHFKSLFLNSYLPHLTCIQWQKWFTFIQEGQLVMILSKDNVVPHSQWPLLIIVNDYLAECPPTNDS